METIKYSLKNNVLSRVCNLFDLLLKANGLNLGYELSVNHSECSKLYTYYQSSYTKIVESYESDDLGIFDLKDNFLRVAKPGEEIKAGEQPKKLIDRNRIKEYTEALNKLNNKEVEVELFMIPKESVKEAYRGKNMKGVNISLLITLGIVS